MLLSLSPLDSSIPNRQKEKSKIVQMILEMLQSNLESQSFSLRNGVCIGVSDPTYIFFAFREFEPSVSATATKERAAIAKAAEESLPYRGNREHRGLPHTDHVHVWQSPKIRLHQEGNFDTVL